MSFIPNSLRLSFTVWTQPPFDGSSFCTLNKNVWFIIRDQYVKYFLESNSNHSSLDYPQKSFWLFYLKKHLESGLKINWFMAIWNIWYLRFRLVNFLWGNIGISGKSQGSSMRKLQVSIKSQIWVMAKKLQKITIFKRLRDVWFW